MIVECAFGHLVSRFQIFHRPIETDINTTDMIVKTCSSQFFDKKKTNATQKEESYHDIASLTLHAGTDQSIQRSSCHRYI